MQVYPNAKNEPPTHSLYYLKINTIYLLNGQVSGRLLNDNCYKKNYSLKIYENCLSAIRFRGGVILQVSCYTLLTRIPTSMATVLLSAPHRTPFRFIGRLEQIRSSPAYLESVRLNPSSPVLLTRNGPLRMLDTLKVTFKLKNSLYK